MRRRSIQLQSRSSFHDDKMPRHHLSGLSCRFQPLSPWSGQVPYVLLTRSPLSLSEASFQSASFDLHVLGMPPAFILSQDQTLHLIVCLAHLLRFAFKRLFFSYPDVLRPSSWIDVSCLVFKDRACSPQALVYITTSFSFRQLLFFTFFIFFLIFLKNITKIALFQLILLLRAIFLPVILFFEAEMLQSKRCFFPFFV